MKLAQIPRTPAILLLATCATCSLGALFKVQCAFDGLPNNLEMYVTGCYSDAYPFWRGRGLADGHFPYFQAPMEYPVLTGLLIWFDGLLTKMLFGPLALDPAFVLTVSIVNTGFAAMVTWLLWRMGLPKSRLWAWALSPLLVLYVGHNWDLLAVTLALAAFMAIDCGRLKRATALAALGAAAKMFPVLLLPLLSLRQLLQRQFGHFFALVALAILAWSAVNLPFALAATERWWEFYALSAERSGTAGSIWELANHYGVFPTDIAQRNSLATLVFVAGATGIIAMGWARYQDRLWLLFTPVLLWFMLTNKVYSPQFDIWVYPFLLITARHWLPIAIFLSGDVAAYFAEMWFFSGQNGGWPALPMEAILIAALVRGIAMIWVIVDAIWRGPPQWLYANTLTEAPREKRFAN